MEWLSWLPIILSAIQLVLILWLFVRSKPVDTGFEEIEALNRKSEELEKGLNRIESRIPDEADRIKDSIDKKEMDSRMELLQTLQSFGKITGEKIETVNRMIDEKMVSMTDKIVQMDKDNLKSLLDSLFSFENRFAENVKSFNDLQREKFGDLSQKQEQMVLTTEKKLDSVRDTMETKIGDLQKQNDAKLEEMRKTVDEKLHQTLETRLGESFKQVSERLEQVHKGLGEMQTLATGVGDLKKALSNVKVRGILGEYQLENLLEQFLSPEQYSKNIPTRPGSNERVEFAICMPGNNEGEPTIWLPIDAKFPTEDYIKLTDAYESGNLNEIDAYKKLLINRVKASAKDIRGKYIEPPYTTDFGIMFLPFEGLYAEVLRLGVFETIQRDYKVTIVGPTTLSAFLNSLQMGFRTLAIQKRSSEVWELLGAVKTEFGKFGVTLEKTKKKLNEAANDIDSASIRSRAIERKLRNVQELPQEESGKILEEGS
jgi:DNA recombination protein RmuC